jgi:hypothetical protein
MKRARLAFVLVVGLLALTLTASATTPVVTVTSPPNGSQDSSPVNFTASARSPDCSAGIAAMRIYTAPGDGAYTTDSNHLDVNLTLAAGSYNTVVQAWDNCGGVGKTPVNITVSGSAQPVPRFLYSSDYNDNKIYEYLVDASTGALTPTSQGSVVTASQPGRIASDQGGFRLYVANTGANELSAYFINRDDGSLQAVPGAPGSLTGFASAVVVHPSGDYVYVTVGSDSSNYIDAFQVQSNGSLSPVAGSPFAAQYGATGAVIDSTGSFLYISTIDASYTEAYAVNKSNGSLSPVVGQPFPLVDQNSSCSPGAEGLAFGQDGQHLVVPELCDGVITVYNVNSTNGTLANAPGSPVIDPQPASYQPVDLEAIAVDPLNRWWYLYETFPGELPAGDIATLTAQDVAERTTQQQCGDLISADPSGKFVYAIGNTTGSAECGSFPGAILGFSVNQSNGTLTPLPGFPLASPNADNFFQDGLVVTK